MNERKASFNLGEEGRLEIEMADFASCVIRVRTAEEKPLMSGRLLAVCPAGATTKQSQKPQSKHDSVSLSTDLGVLPAAKRPGDVNPHARTEFALPRSKQL